MVGEGMQDAMYISLQGQQNLNIKYSWSGLDTAFEQDWQRSTDKEYAVVLQ